MFRTKIFPLEMLSLRSLLILLENIDRDKDTDKDTMVMFSVAGFERCDGAIRKVLESPKLFMKILQMTSSRHVPLLPLLSPSFFQTSDPTSTVL